MRQALGIGASLSSLTSHSREGKKVMRKRRGTSWTLKPRREMLMPLMPNARRSKRRR